MSKISLYHERFVAAEEKIDKHLPEYQTIITSLENNSRSNDNKGGSNMKILAKAQEDLADYLAQHVLIVQSLKSLKPTSNTQSTILKYYIKGKCDFFLCYFRVNGKCDFYLDISGVNVISNCYFRVNVIYLCYFRSKCDFYLENMSTFRLLKRQLSDTSPPEILEVIQRIMNKDSIISAHLYIRQLIYECINICSRYKLDDTCPRILMTVEENIEKDTLACLRREGDDCNQHEQLVQQMIKSQMVNHKLIRTSRTLLKTQGAQHAATIMLSRSYEVLKQLLLQLQLKTPNKSFSDSKNILEESVVKLESFNIK
ncbi:hypothetical protein LOTGIDRAFT_231197 [Lottia gigantea]|uniref:Uncharacterized protein n=1 Tax=Lottia gigantea TaxID=225164 RepID=V4AYS6_LOTGI|nr:hypothetical protein LOTGIDRAFT_231197 [Lottia gigantea]ESO98831.1 hypothetical protein LOTGIDRAFT_231197 [Lottia gigantea]